MLDIFFREDGILDRYLPVYTKVFIFDADTSVCLWGIEIITFVLEDRRLAKNSKAMGKTPWNKELTMIIL